MAKGSYRSWSSPVKVSESDSLIILSITSNIPKKAKSKSRNDYDDYYDEYSEKKSYTKGNYGKAIICLSDPRLFVIVDNSNNQYILDYIETDIIETLERLPRPLPYYIDDITAPDIVESLTDRFRDDTGNRSGFITLSAEYIDLSKKYKVINQSKKLKAFAIPEGGLTVLKLMERKGMFKKFS